MPLATDPRNIPKEVEVALPFGTWDDDERVYLKPVYDVFSREAARDAATIEYPDGSDKKGNPKVRRELVKDRFFYHLVANHIERWTIKGTRDDGTIYVTEYQPSYLVLLGPENVQFLMDTIFSLAGQQPGGYVTSTDSGRRLDFRGSNRVIGAQDSTKEPLHPPEHADDLELSSTGEDSTGDVVVGLPRTTGRRDRPIHGSTRRREPRSLPHIVGQVANAEHVAG